eukprot:scaffold551_cov395-Prasinococcus_capsulatus_cf.AAC.15
MGISKKLDADQSSFDTLASSGTFGWQAPEQLLKSSRMSSSDDSSSTRGASSGTLRLTRGIDIFSLGCLIFYVLSEGKHPFGERFERNTNILRGIPDLSALKGEFPEAFDLVSAMLAYNSRDRPSATAAAAHPFFWSLAKRLRFLVGMPSLCQHRQCPIEDVSDYIDSEPTNSERQLHLEAALNREASRHLQGGWDKKLDTGLLENLGKYRKYSGMSARDLLRVIRNKSRHYRELPESLRRLLGPLPGGFMNYFSERFPLLVLDVHTFVLSELGNEEVFQQYLEPK